MLSVADAAWIARLLDGEGCIMLHGRKDAVALRLTATNTHRTSLEHFVSITGIGAVIWRPRTNPRHKAAGSWLVNGHAAESVLRQTLPYMVTKRKQAELAITFQQRLRDPALKADRTWQVEYLARMKALNRRGPA